MYTKRNYGILPRTIGGLMEDVFQNGWNRLNEEIVSLSAPVNILENESNYRMHLYAPGLKKEELKINTDRGILNISYEHSDVENSKEEGKWLRNEFRAKSFKRSFTMNDNIDASQIIAKYTDGVLYITLPKKLKADPDNKEIHIA